MSEEGGTNRTWWQGVRARASAARNALVSYLPVGIISATVITAGASAIGASGMLGSVGQFIGNNMGASGLVSGAFKVARIVGVGLLIHGVMGMGKNQHALGETQGAGAHTPGRSRDDDKTQSLGLEHTAEFVQNDMKIETPSHIPMLKGNRGMDISGTC